MCQNNLNEAIIDYCRVDPSNPNKPGDDFIIVDYRVDPSNPNSSGDDFIIIDWRPSPTGDGTIGSLAEDHYAAFFLPAVQGEERPMESLVPTDQYSRAAFDHSFELMV